MRLVLEQVRKRRAADDRVFELTIERLVLAPGERLAVVGQSGSGKSTLLDLAGLALAPDGAGTFRLEREDGVAAEVGELWRRRDLEALAALRARHFGYVVQSGALLPFLSVEDNVHLPLSLAGRRDRDRVRDLLDRLGIARLERVLPERLSFGQRQRVAVARALVHRPDFLLADEPTASLDPDNARRVMEALLELTAAEGSALLVVSHDLDLLDDFALPRAQMAGAPDGRTHRAWLVPAEASRAA
ncbi:MAG TPA: ATP-binding cassette domain-containing protein [Geminicoccaceae bacterium]|nr:ATP-binding cassette domain-containing protein [Geminicoccaceae bacterium]